MPQEAPLDPEAEGTHLLVLGPSQIREKELVTYLISVENARDLAHAPLRLAYNPDVLEFHSTGEGSLLSTGGAATQFLGGPSAKPGLVDIAISRLSPRTGVQGSGTLCSVTFVAKATGESPIITSGSRLLDSSAHAMEFRRDDTHVAVR